MPHKIGRILLFFSVFFALSAIANDFQRLNGVMWFYSSANQYKFQTIERDLQSLKDRGIRIVGIYSPYAGDPKKWLGCAPLDYYATPAANGTLDDWKNLVQTAHTLGMKVVVYFVNIYINSDSSYFQRAIQQYKAGDFVSPEVSSFRWTTNPRATLPSPAAGPSAWKFNTEAGAYYWSLWDEAGFDFSLPSARAEVEKFTKFWLDTGVDGFMWDAGVVDPAFKPFMVDLPKTFTSNDKWITFESTASEEADMYHNFGLTSWFNFEDNDEENNYSHMVRSGDSADDLEEALKNADYARDLGKTTHAWSIYEGGKFLPYADELKMRVQEAALLAGAGILYGSPDYELYSAWPEQQRRNWERVLQTVNEHPALWPEASRERLSLGRSSNAYAMARTSKDDRQTVVLVYNFKSQAQTLRIDFSDYAHLIGTTPVDLYSAQNAPKIQSSSYTIRLPPYGFRILELKRP